MKLNDYFKIFIGNISLNPTREDRINSAISAWERIFENDEETEPYFESFLNKAHMLLGLQ